MIKADCTKTTSVSKIKVEENQRRVIINNPSKIKYSVTAVDGCLIKNSIACDWLISEDSVGDLLIELKGSDVDHAAKQIMSSAEYIDSNGIALGQKAGLIVCSKYPRVDTTVQKIKNAFAKKYQAPLHVVNIQGEFNFSNLFKFSGIKKT
jgi:hypothetical protein